MAPRLSLGEISAWWAAAGPEFCSTRAKSPVQLSWDELAGFLQQLKDRQGSLYWIQLSQAGVDFDQVEGEGHLDGIREHL